MGEKNTHHAIVETISGLLDTEASDGGRVAVGHRAGILAQRAPQHRRRCAAVATTSKSG